jgi:hypothetical protein
MLVWVLVARTECVLEMLPERMIGLEGESGERNRRSDVGRPEGETGG